MVAAKPVTHSAIPATTEFFTVDETTDREIRGLEDFVWIPRWENSVDLSPTQVVLAGVSGAFGSNETGGECAHPDLRRAIFSTNGKARPPRADFRS